MMEELKLNWRQRHRLQEQLKDAQDVRLYRRTLAVLEVARGRSVAQVAQALGVTRQSVYNWIASYLGGWDPSALQDEPHPGRPGFWTEDHQALLRWLMERPPGQFGYFAGDWTVPLLQEQWRHDTGARLSAEIVRRGLQGLGYVWKRGRYELEPDPELEKKTPHSGSNPQFAAAQRAVGGG
jgi:transposase